jgi:hypothetical protein
MINPNCETVKLIAGDLFDQYDGYKTPKRETIQSVAHDQKQPYRLVMHIANWLNMWVSAECDQKDLGYWPDLDYVAHDFLDNGPLAYLAAKQH